VSFDIPYPPIYGGIIDVFSKIKYLKDNGYEVILHCFEYGKKQKNETLLQFCHQVNYYPRKQVYRVFFSAIPYIIKSRSNKELLANLLLDDAPIIFEGLHTCFYLAHPALESRKKIVWLHNIEPQYYHNLSKFDQNLLYKIHYSVEAKKLKLFESKMKYATYIFTIHPDDVNYCKQFNNQVYHLPSFHLFDKLDIDIEGQDYVLTHASLDIVENNQAMYWLVSKVFAHLKHKVYIIGKKPKKSLLDLVSKYPHIHVFSDLSEEDYNLFVQKARVVVHFSMQNIGLKQRLIKSAFLARHIIVNEKMIYHEPLKSICHVVNEASEMQEKINELFDISLSEEYLKLRKDYIDNFLSNEQNFKKFKEIIEI
jgi:hypothetical protein